MFDSLWPCGLQPARLLCPWGSPGKNTGLGFHALLQGIFLTQKSNPCLLHLLHWQADSLPFFTTSATWEHVKVKVAQSYPTLWNPMDYTVHGILQARILEWVAISFSRGSSQPRDQIQVSCITGGFFTSWATREPKNTGVGSLSLLQWIFPIQELNQGLLHCRQILYQLSYQGSPAGNIGPNSSSLAQVSN